MAQDGNTAGGNSYTIDNVTFPVGRTKLNSIFNAVRTTNMGSSAPDLVAGQFWIDNTTPSATVWTMYFFDGTDSISFATIDTTNNTVNFIDSTFTQLSSNLDLNSYTINGTGNIDITGSGTFSGDLTVDTNTLFVDSADNRVGILTTDPKTPLHIQKSALTGFISRTASNLTLESSGGNEIYFASGDSSYGQIRFGDTASTYSGGIQYEHSTDTMLIVANGSEKMRIGSSELVINEGSADYDFRVESNARTHALFVDGGDSSVYIGKNDSNFNTAGIRLNVAGLNYSQFTRSGGQPLTLNRTDSNGDILGLYYAGGKIGELGVISNDNFVIINPHVNTSKGIGIADDNLYPVAGDGNSSNNVLDIGDSSAKFRNAYFGGTINFGDSHTIGNDASDNLEITSSSAENIIYNSSGGFHVFKNNGTESLRIDNSRLGIGRDSFDSDDGLLAVGALSGASTPSILSLYGNNSTAYGGNEVAVSAIASYTDNTAFGSRLIFKTNDSSNVLQERLRISTNDVIINEGSADVDFRVESNNNSNMLYVNGGNDRVGVGINPTDRFHVSGGTAMSGAWNRTIRLDAIYPSLIFESTASNGFGGIAYDSGSSSPMVFWTGGTSSDVHGTGKRALMLGKASGTTVFNEDSEDVDFRVESNTNTHMLFVDGGSDTVLMAKSSVDNTTAGHRFNSDGFVSHVRSGNGVMRLNRTSNDGDILEIYKDGATVGSIAVKNANNLQIRSTSSAHSGIEFGTNTILPADASGALTNNQIDFGASSNRYKDLYLGGNIYLGGTGSANALDDYEEGSWTPTADSGLSGFTIAKASYTKIGNQVTVTAYISPVGTKNSSNLIVGGLPFTPSTSLYQPASCDLQNKMRWVRSNANTDYLVFYNDDRTQVVGTDIGLHIIFNLTYLID